MSLIVQKYGGTNVGNPERIKNVARRVVAAQKQGHGVVVVCLRAAWTLATNAGVWQPSPHECAHGNGPEGIAPAAARGD